MHLRAIVGPLFVGFAAWCAAGVVTLVSADAVSDRVAIPAPWWVAAIAFVAALAIPAFRQRPLIAAPALVSTMPWWPVPIPAVALIWTGPMAWVPIVASCAIAAGGGFGAVISRMASRQSVALAAVATAVVSVLVAWSLAPRLPGGDEPHYLVITQSLLQDGDLRIENNHAARDYEAYFGGTIDPDYLVRGQDGEIYSIHAPGVSALVAPAFAAFGYRGAQAVVMLLAALTGALVWKAGWLVTGDRRAAWFAWAAIVGSATFLLQSVTIFPDGPGALVVAAASVVLIRVAKGRGDAGAGANGAALPADLILAGTGALLALLPWLHTRFVVLAAGFGVAIAWAIWRDDAPLRDRLRRIGLFLTCPAVSALAWFGFFYSVYGTPNPTAPYGASPETSWLFVPGGLVALLADQQFGLLAATPVLIACLFGLAGGAQAGSRRAVVAIVAVYFAVVCTYWMWWAGRPATPGRFTAAALPALAVVLAWAWHRSGTVARTLLASLLTVSLGVSAVLVSVRRGLLAWNDRTADAGLLQWLGPLVDLPRGLPSFFWRLDPARLSSEWPFVTHVIVTAGMLSLAGLLVVWLSPRAGSAGESRRLIVACAGMLTMMVAVQAGWWLNGVAGPDPARSQWALVARAGESGGVLRLSSLSIRRASLGAVRPVVVPEAPGRTDAGVLWATTGVLPPARLTMDVTSGGAGRVVVRLGRGQTPWRTIDVRPGITSAALFLPAGASGLTVEPDEALRAAGGSIAFVVDAAYPPVGSTARAVADYGDLEVFFLDDEVFAEPEGFWVRGGRAGSFVLGVADARRATPLRIQNGGAENVVRIRVGGEWQERTMAPSEVFELDVPLLAGAAALTVESSTGFRPSDGGSADTRFLGVRVEPGSQPGGTSNRGPEIGTSPGVAASSIDRVSNPRGQQTPPIFNRRFATPAPDSRSPTRPVFVSFGRQ